MLDFTKTMEIKSNVWYQPQDIKKYGLIKTKRGKTYYNFILNEIEAGRLKAENRGKGKTPYYYVLGKWLIQYNQKYSVFIDPELENESTPHGANI